MLKFVWGKYEAVSKLVETDAINFTLCLFPDKHLLPLTHLLPDVAFSFLVSAIEITGISENKW